MSLQRLVDMDVNGQDVLARRGSIEQDSLVRDETARTMGTLLDKIDAQLKRALTDRDSAAGMLVELLRSSADVSLTREEDSADRRIASRPG